MLSFFYAAQVTQNYVKLGQHIQKLREEQVIEVPDVKNKINAGAGNAGFMTVYEAARTFGTDNSVEL